MKNYEEMSVNELLRALAAAILTSARLTILILRRSWREIIWGLLTLAAAALCLATLTGFINLQATPGRLSKWIAWGAELSSHFRLQYLVVLAALAITFLIRRNFVRALGTGLFALINLAVVVPFFLAPTPASHQGAALRAFMLNVGNNNRAGGEVIDLVLATDPDIVLLVEAGITRQELFLPPLLIPIDHALVSPDITVSHFEVGPSVGSDHYPLLLDFTLGAAMDRGADEAAAGTR